MLLVKTIVKQSTIPNGGLGLFADQDIPKGFILWEFNKIVDVTIPVEKLEYLIKVEKDYIKKYAYREGDNLILCSDDDKYINHSDTPNVLDIFDERNFSVSVAARDIKAGEELLCDYSTFDDNYKNGVVFGG